MESELGDQISTGLWARRYVEKLSAYSETRSNMLRGSTQIAQTLIELLRFCSSRAWAKTEGLLFRELKKHQIAVNLIDPWKIAEDSRLLFEKALESYQENLTPGQFSVPIAQQCGQVRQYYSAIDPRILGFVSMQFHYTGQFLLDELAPMERGPVVGYFKIMEDYLCMPLQRAYRAAAQQPYGSATLRAVQQLLPLSTQIAEFICLGVAEHNADYRCHTGSLQDPRVRLSSIRDAEMVQIYLCLAAMENSIDVLKKELFPLCVMLYPPLNVSWALVRQLIDLLSYELKKRLSSANSVVFSPYLRALRRMFSEDVFPQDRRLGGRAPDAICYAGRAHITHYPISPPLTAALVTPPSCQD